VPGRVTVEPAKPIFHRGECVQVRVANGLTYPVYAEARRSACTSILLERRLLIGWRGVTGCVDGMGSAPVLEFVPGYVYEVGIDPYSPRLTYGITPPAFGVGIYRAVFSYFNSTAGIANIITSPAFAVTP
jgi:hypothetical protein